MDDMKAGVVDAPVNTGGATATETPEVLPGTGSVAPGTEETAGTSQEAPEGGQVNGQEARQRGPSKLDTIRELRAKIREQRSYWESEVGGLKSQLDEIRNQIASGQNGQKPRKTFFEAPEDVLGETFNSGLSNLKKELLSELRQDQSQTREASARAQELSEAAKFIRTQKGMTEDDIQDIREILASRTYIESMPPMEQAKYALHLWQEERGIMDKTGAKQRASTVTGAPPGAVGQKTWTESEINAELAKFPPNPANYTPEDETRFKKLDDEWRRAYREKRVSK